MIGFKAVFLNSNHDGYQLYIDNGFSEISEFIVPNDNNIETSECTPLLLLITDDLLL